MTILHGFNCTILYSSISIHLFISEAVSFIVQPEAVPASVGQTVILECEATGVPKPSYLWFKGRDPLPTQTTCRLSIEKVTPEDAGMYICRASNEVNIEFSCWAEIKVNQPKVLRPGTRKYMYMYMCMCMWLAR